MVALVTRHLNALLAAALLAISALLWADLFLPKQVLESELVTIGPRLEMGGKGVRHYHELELRRVADGARVTLAVEDDWVVPTDVPRPARLRVGDRLLVARTPWLGRMFRVDRKDDPVPKAHYNLRWPIGLVLGTLLAVWQLWHWRPRSSKTPQLYTVSYGDLGPPKPGETPRMPIRVPIESQPPPPLGKALLAAFLQVVSFVVGLVLFRLVTPF